MVLYCFPRLSSAQGSLSDHGKRTFFMIFREPVLNSNRQPLIDFIIHKLNGIITYYDHSMICLSCYDYQMGYICGYLNRYIGLIRLIEESELQSELDNWRARVPERVQYNDEFNEGVVRYVSEMYADMDPEYDFHVTDSTTDSESLNEDIENMAPSYLSSHLDLQEYVQEASFSSESIYDEYIDEHDDVYEFSLSQDKYKTNFDDLECVR
ncbi:hypothetical protein ROZALSC1DRAFT_29033 [Rozella allomycis CSF55]|uniref:Uncharacterized protein n=1 Tax=Rozella allomycis (strain CSF55) TaxID=988480 RepID=A0A4P9YIY3_ROZAC|nr:hypothetical protein ROZALSC1DRAFT_29033 [Rozella allomycis CSF55]